MSRDEKLMAMPAEGGQRDEETEEEAPETMPEEQAAQSDGFEQAAKQIEDNKRAEVVENSEDNANELTLEEIDAALDEQLSRAQEKARLRRLEQLALERRQRVALLSTNADSNKENVQVKSQREATSQQTPGRKCVKVLADWQARVSSLGPVKPSVHGVHEPQSTALQAERASLKRALEAAQRKTSELEAALAAREASSEQLSALCEALGKRARLAEERSSTLASLVAQAAALSSCGASVLSASKELRFVLLDTNCFMHRLAHVQALLTAPQLVLIVPLVVLRELDALKQNRVEAIAQLAREAMRWLHDAAKDPSKVRGQAAHEVWQPQHTSHAAHSADDWIVNCARWYVDHFGRDRVGLVSQDRNLVLKARLHYDVPAQALDEALSAECRLQLALTPQERARSPLPHCHQRAPIQHHRQQQQQQQQQHAFRFQVATH